jgi:cAMP-dependent protein kinase regulator
MKYKINREIKQLESGGAFGEKAILEEKPRTATVRVCSDTCSMGVLHKDDYMRIIGQTFKNQVCSIVNSLKQFEIFKSLADLTLKKIYYYTQEVNLAPGNFLYKQGQPVSGVYFVVEGSVNLLVSESLSKYQFIPAKPVRYTQISET